MKQLRMKMAIRLISKAAFLLLVFILLLAVPVSSFSADKVWVLKETKYGMPNRTKSRSYDSMLNQMVNHVEKKITIGESAFNYKLKITRGGNPFADGLFVFKYDTPPQELIPKDSVMLNMSGSAQGNLRTNKQGFMLSIYEKPNAGKISRKATERIELKSGLLSDSKKIQFTVPETYDGLLSIKARISESSQYHVEWLYEPGKSSGKGRGKKARGKEDKQHERWNPTKEECARMRQEIIDQGTSTVEGGGVGIAIAAMGDIEVRSCGGGVLPLTKGVKIKIGDCIKTGANGRVRIQMGDRDEKHKCGPSVINVATNGEMCFTKYLASFDDPPKQNSAIELIKGAIRMFFKGWGRNSSVSVKTGVTVCGIRGSEVIISYDPEKERVLAYVFNGLMDVTNTQTGATKSLTKNQKLVVSKGVIGKVEPLSKKEWDSLVKENGLEIGARQPAGKGDILKEAIGYFTGIGGSVDFEKARGLFMEASQQGNPLAKMWVARCYFGGMCGFEKNKSIGKQMAKEIFGHVLKAAQNGDSGAMFLVASSYSVGLATPQDYAKAASWYQKAAEKGNPLAMTNLGFIHQNGHGTPQDYQKAITWYHKAADKGVTFAMHSIGMMHFRGDGVEKNTKHAISWFQKACSIGLPDSCGNLGYMHKKALGVKKDLKLAVDFYKKGCDKGGSKSCTNLGLMYMKGSGVEQDYEKAIKYHKEGCSRGDSRGCALLGYMYEAALGVNENLELAVNYYKKGCEGGNAVACTNLGAMYEQGRGLKQDYGQAVYYYKKGCDGGFAGGCGNLGRMIYHGYGTKADHKRGRELMEQACEKGDKTSCEKLKKLSE